MPKIPVSNIFIDEPEAPRPGYAGTEIPLDFAAMAEAPSQIMGQTMTQIGKQMFQVGMKLKDQQDKSLVLDLNASYAKANAEFQQKLQTPEHQENPLYLDDDGTPTEGWHLAYQQHMEDWRKQNEGTIQRLGRNNKKVWEQQYSINVDSESTRLLGEASKHRITLANAIAEVTADTIFNSTPSVVSDPSNEIFTIIDNMEITQMEKDLKKDNYIREWNKINLENEFTFSTQETDEAYNVISDKIEQMPRSFRENLENLEILEEKIVGGDFTTHGIPLTEQQLKVAKHNISMQRGKIYTEYGRIVTKLQDDILAGKFMGDEARVNYQALSYNEKETLNRMLLTSTKVEVPEEVKDDKTVIQEEVQITDPETGEDKTETKYYKEVMSPFGAYVNIPEETVIIESHKPYLDLEKLADRRYAKPDEDVMVIIREAEALGIDPEQIWANVYEANKIATERAMETRMKTYGIDTFTSGVDMYKIALAKDVKKFWDPSVKSVWKALKKDKYKGVKGMELLKLEKALLDIAVLGPLDFKSSQLPTAVYMPETAVVEEIRYGPAPIPGPTPIDPKIRKQQNELIKTFKSIDDLHAAIDDGQLLATGPEGVGLEVVDWDSEDIVAELEIGGRDIQLRPRDISMLNTYMHVVNDMFIDSILPTGEADQNFLNWAETALPINIDTLFKLFREGNSYQRGDTFKDEYNALFKSFFVQTMDSGAKSHLIHKYDIPNLSAFE